VINFKDLKSTGGMNTHGKMYNYFVARGFIFANNNLIFKLQRANEGFPV